MSFKKPLSAMTFQVQIYWKDQKTERLKKMQSFFILKSSNKVHYISTLNYWSGISHFYNQWISSHFCWKWAKEIMGREKIKKFCKVKAYRKINFHLWKRFFSSRVHFKPSFKGKTFIWGTKKCPSYTVSALCLLHRDWFHCIYKISKGKLENKKLDSKM